MKDPSHNQLETPVLGVWKAVNDEFCSTSCDNELYLFDFTFVIHFNEGDRKEARIESSYVCKHKQYPKLLDRFLKQGKQALFQEDRSRVIEKRNFERQSRLDWTTHRPKFRFYRAEIASPETVAFAKWHDFLEHEGFGGASYISFSQLTLTNERNIQLGVYCVTKNKLEGDSESIIAKHTYDFLFTHGLKRALDEYHLELIRQATRAAVSQVLARCFSHDTGSHVLARFKTVTEIASIKSWQGGQYTGKFLGPIGTTGQGFRHEQIAIFNKYLKERLDFLADVATAEPTLESGMSVRNEILRGLHINKIMLDRISGIADNSFNFDFRLRRMDVHSSRYEIVDQNMVLLAAIPNDVLGCQAFYIIIENIIRNTVKHSPSVQEDLTCFSIDIRDHEFRNDLLEVSIYDNVFRSRSDITELAANRNNTFNDPILDPKTYKVRQEALGTIEMDVCAAYLRKVPPEQVDDSRYTINKQKYNKDFLTKKKVPNLIYAYVQEKDDEATAKEASLGYKFCLRKPQEVLILDNQLVLSIDSQNQRDLDASGILIVTSDAVRKLFEKEPSRTFNHQFMAYTGDYPSELLEKFGKALPRRVVSISPAKIDEFVEDLTKPNISAVRTFLREEMAVEIMRRKKITRLVLNSSSKNGERIFAPSSSIENGKEFEVIFSNHGAEWPEKRNYNSFFYVASHHRIDDEFLKPGGKIETKFHQAELAETVLTTIGVLDERLQAFAQSSTRSRYRSNGTVSGKIPYIDLFREQGVLMPDSRIDKSIEREADLNSVTLKESQEIKIKFWCAKNIDGLDFLIIHLGLVEKLIQKYDKDPETVRGKIQELVGLNNYRKVIITSGRGTPANLPTDTYYVPFPALQNIFETLFDKVLLVKLMYNARRVKP